MIGKVINGLKVVTMGALMLEKECDDKQLQDLAKDVDGFTDINDSLQKVMDICCQFSTSVRALYVRRVLIYGTAIYQICLTMNTNNKMPTTTDP